MSKTKSIVTEYDGICFFCGKPAECETALEAVDSCVDADTIIKYYRGGTA